MNAASSRRRHGTGNTLAFLALMCGIMSWVPLIVIVTGPLTLVFFLLAHVAAPAPGVARRLPAAWTGLVLATLALVLQAGLAGLAAIPGLIGAMLGG